jgi:hypothetical protein
MKKTTPTGDPFLISIDEYVKVGTVVEGKRKYDVVKIQNNNREQFQLIIRSLTETDAGDYTCQIYLPNQNYKQWPKKIGHLTVQSKFLPPLPYPTYSVKIGHLTAQSKFLHPLPYPTYSVKIGHLTAQSKFLHPLPYMLSKDRTLVKIGHLTAQSKYPPTLHTQ